MTFPLELNPAKDVALIVKSTFEFNDCAICTSLNYYIIPITRPIIPTTNNAMIIVIGETFFFNNLQHNKVNNKAARPGINESKFCCKVVTLI